MAIEHIGLAHGSGGKEMLDLISDYDLSYRGNWKNYDNDAATLDIGEGRLLVFTTDSFIVSPIFFPGGDIGHIAMCGTINDLAVIGADPLGISLALVIEEGFPTADLTKILASIKKISRTTKTPVVTGDTKVMEKGKLDKIVINTAGVGVVKKNEVLTKQIKPGDKIILSGGLGEHAVALLSKRFDYTTTIVSDSKPIVEEIKKVKKFIKVAKDPTRGGISASLHEIRQRYNVGMLLDEESIPVKPGVRKVTELLGINVYELACEGRFVCIAAKNLAHTVERILKKYNEAASIIGEITQGDTIIVQSVLGKRLLPIPTGRIVPRIC